MGAVVGRLGDRGEVGLVVDLDGVRRLAQLCTKQCGDRYVAPPQVGSERHGAGGPVDEAGDPDHQSDRLGAAFGEIIDRPGQQLHETLDDHLGCLSGGIEGQAALARHVAVEVERERGDVVHVDLGSDPTHPAAVDLHHRGGSADGSPLGAAVPDQSALGELGHQARDGRLVEPQVDGQSGA